MVTSLAVDPHEFGGPHEFDVTAFGVRLRVLVEAADLVPDVERALPPRATPADGADVVVTFVLRADEDDLWQLWQDGTSLGPATGAEVAVCLLEEHLAMALASSARGPVFVRAGVVQAGGRAIVLPGPSLSGRTTLVDALVREGAEFYSDTFAVLDEEGWVYAYRSLGPGEPPPERLRIGLIAVAPYVPRASWAPEQGGPADGALSLLAHAATSEEPPELLKVLGAAAAEALTLRGERGEAAEVAPALLSSLVT
jgi:hypothetical protein